LSLTHRKSTAEDREEGAELRKGKLSLRCRKKQPRMHEWKGAWHEKRKSRMHE